MRIRAIHAAGTLVLAWVFIGCMDEDRSPNVGSPAPDITVNDASQPDKKVSLKDLRGKVVILDFWATWCGPCRMAMPHLQQLYHDKKDQGLDLMAITGEDPTTVNEFAVSSKLDIPCYTDDALDAAKAYGVTSYPTTAVIGKDGRLVYYKVGTDSSVEAEIDDAVATAMK